MTICFGDACFSCVTIYNYVVYDQLCFKVEGNK